MVDGFIVFGTLSVDIFQASRGKNEKPTLVLVLWTGDNNISLQRKVLHYCEMNKISKALT